MSKNWNEIFVFSFIWQIVFLCILNVFVKDANQVILLMESLLWIKTSESDFFGFYPISYE